MSEEKRPWLLVSKRSSQELGKFIGEKIEEA
jgi:hypothetical protein